MSHYYNPNCIETLISKGIKTVGQLVDGMGYVDKNKELLKEGYKQKLLDSGLFDEETVESLYPLVSQCAEDGEVRVGITPAELGKLVGSSRNCVQNWCRADKVENYFTVDGYSRIIPAEEVIRVVKEKK